MAHTPGPWRYDYNGGVMHGSDGSVVLDGNRLGSLRDDDARLIAAAPDLLSACKGLLEECEEHDRDYHWNTRPERLAAARAAIAKAKGGG